MGKLQYDQFSVTILPPATEYHPVDGRKYSLVMSTEDSDCRLAIGHKYLMNLHNKESDNILTAEWKPRLGEYILTGKVNFHENNSDEGIPYHFEDIQSNVHNAIKLIVKADRVLFSFVPWLLDAPIYIELDSHFRKNKSIQYFGTPRHFLNS